MKKFLTIFISILLINGAYAQNPSISTVKIELEKITNIPALYKELAPEWYDMIKEHLPKNTTTYFDLIADTSHSVYKPGRESRSDFKGEWQLLSGKNNIYTDFKTNTSISQKPVFEETF